MNVNDDNNCTSGHNYAGFWTNKSICGDVKLYELDLYPINEVMQKATEVQFLRICDQYIDDFLQVLLNLTASGDRVNSRMNESIQEF